MTEKKSALKDHFPLGEGGGGCRVEGLFLTMRGKVTKLKLIKKFTSKEHDRA